MAPTIEEQTIELSRKMRNLHKDIVVEILSWVPANSLLQWRGLCKYWFSLIKNSSFVQKHLHHSTTTHDPSVLISAPYLNGSDLKCYLNYTTCSLSSSIKINSHPFKSLNPVKDLITSVNGLLFCYEYDQKRFCMWNPCTKEYIVLPDLPFIKCDRHHKTLVCQYGFGYDQTMNDYKVVVRNEYKDNCLPSEVQVYTLGTSSWRKIRPDPIKELQTQHHCGVFVNGAVHWLDSLGEKIISFDIGKEMYKEVLIKQPKCSQGIRRRTMGLQAFEGSLCCLVELTIANQSIEKCCLEMWMMSDYDVTNKECSWAQLFSTTLPSDSLGSNYDSLKLLKLTKKGEILMLKEFKDLVLCDPKTKGIRTLNSICEEQKHAHSEAVYVESLVSLNSGIYYGGIDKRIERKENNIEDETEIVKNEDEQNCKRGRQT